MLCLEGQALAVEEQLEYILKGAQSFTKVMDRLRNSQRAFFEVRVFNPFARMYSGLTLSQAYRANEN